MAQLISHPFMLSSNGSVATIDQNSDEYIAQQLAIICTTEPGERLYVPGFGISDPAFQGFEQIALKTQLETYGPEVQITDVIVTFPEDGVQNVKVVFDNSVLLETGQEDEG